MKTILLIAVLLLSGCATAGPGESITYAREKNALTGADIGCTITGPLCIFMVGPLIGMAIGQAMPVER